MLIGIMTITQTHTDASYELNFIQSIEQTEICILHVTVIVRLSRFNVQVTN